MGVTASQPIEALSSPAGPGTLFPEGARVGVINAFGVEAVLAYRKDARECRRRAKASTPALVRPDVLDLLMGLPIGEAVSLASLTAAERRALKHVPKGVVTRDALSITRWAVQPLQVDLAVVPGRGWESALEKAERFTPFCARAILIDRPLRQRDEAIMQADFYGIGLLTITADVLDVLVPPRPFERKRYTPAGWMFVEEAFQQLG